MTHFNERKTESASHRIVNGIALALSKEISQRTGCLPVLKKSENGNKIEMILSINQSVDDPAKAAKDISDIVSKCNNEFNLKSLLDKNGGV